MADFISVVVMLAVFACCVLVLRLVAKRVGR